MQFEPYIRYIVFKEIVTKNDLNGPNMDSCFIIKVLISNFYRYQTVKQTQNIESCV